MNYRELQAKVKAAGLNAKGSKAELEARLAGVNDPQPVITHPKPVKKSGVKGLRKFVFSGDPIGGHDPAWCSDHGYMFKLNGSPIPVTDEVAKKLATHSHFTEV